MDIGLKQVGPIGTTCTTCNRKRLSVDLFAFRSLLPQFMSRVGESKRAFLSFVDLTIVRSRIGIYIRTAGPGDIDL